MRSSRLKLVAHRASVMIVALVFALSVAGHGFSERAEDHLSRSSDVVLSMAVPEAHNSPSDALCGHVHGEHHQFAPCALWRAPFNRNADRLFYASFDAYATSRETTPPHGPPRA